MEHNLPTNTDIMERPKLEDYQIEIHDGQDFADWFEAYYKALEKYADYLEARVGQVDAIVNYTVAELKEVAKKASDKRETEYAINGFHETPKEFSIGDVRVIIESLKEVKCN